MTVLKIGDSKLTMAITDGVVSIIEKGNEHGLSHGDAMNCLITATLILITKFDDPLNELENIIAALQSNAATDAIKYYKKQRNKQNGK